MPCQPIAELRRPSAALVRLIVLYLKPCASNSAQTSLESLGCAVSRASNACLQGRVFGPFAPTGSWKRLAGSIHGRARAGTRADWRAFGIFIPGKDWPIYIRISRSEYDLIRLYR